ncbi:flagellar type III secretion system pore protein FliP [Paenibacillus turpanensis]|uniref:flagellar type III secretion system pore protein FliP n=1 Tax=Paenibacillus turpanensis TaxID=2689078 RepID=UPI001408B12F|nr:flagellar type III secretion system pore protein FliP [Paenibacillus turpanensis]
MNIRLIAVAMLLLFSFAFGTAETALAADPAGGIGIPGIDVNIGTSNNPADVSSSINLILLITLLSLAPAILIMMTCFTRIVIVLSFVRTSLATQQMPPNQVLIGLALFITLFVMSPVIGQVNEEAYKPYMRGEITQTEAISKASVPIKKFMAAQTREKDLQLFLNYTGTAKPQTVEEIPLTVLVPAFAISEIKTAFQMGFMIFIPFLVIDMVVASTLMAMGMMMLPPVMISLPFKILLFILVDGWYLVVKSLLFSFNT